MNTHGVDGVGVEQFDSGPWRDGKLLVYGDPSGLPRRCMRCNGPTDRLEHARLRWQPRGRGPGVILAFEALSAMDMLSRTRTVDLWLPRCEWCKPWVNARVVSTVFGLAAATLGVGSLCTSLKGSDPWPFFRCLIAAGVCFVVAIVAATWPREARVVDVRHPFVWLAGFSPEYLAALPPYTGRHE